MNIFILIHMIFLCFLNIFNLATCIVFGMIKNIFFFKLNQFNERKIQQFKNIKLKLIKIQEGSHFSIDDMDI